MAAQFRSLSLLLLLLLTFQEMMPSEAVDCYTPSKVFKGLCINDMSCSVICLTQGFTSGKCKSFKCVCAKKCKPHHGDGGDYDYGGGGHRSGGHGGGGHGGDYDYGGGGHESGGHGGGGHGGGGHGGDYDGSGDYETPAHRGGGHGGGDYEPPVHTTN